jgi:riboflavin transporter FmnP
MQLLLEEESKMSNNNMNGQSSTVKLAKMGMLVAISIVLVYFIHFPLIPAVPFLEYDPADIPIMMGAFAFGPWAGLLITVVTSLVQGFTVSAGSGVYGIIMHIIATGTFVIVAGSIYKGKKTKKRAIIALACGVIAWILIMIPANLFITPAFMGMPREALMAFMPGIVLFNFLKSTINAVITFLLYKRISGFLHR